MPMFSEVPIGDLRKVEKIIGFWMISVAIALLIHPLPLRSRLRSTL